MFSRMTKVWVVGLMLAWCGAARAQKGPEEVLTEKGLTKVGLTYLLEGDIKLADGLKKVRLAKKQCDDYIAKKAALEKELTTVKSSMEQWQREYDDLHVDLPRTKDVPHYNKVVAEINSRVAKLKEAARYREEKEKELARLVDPKNTYLAAVQELAEKMEATQARYEALAADEQVKTALARINDKGPGKAKLGPSANFAQELAQIRKEHSAINSGVVKVSLELGVPSAVVTLNGVVTVTMIIDSGAAIVTLTPDTARQLGLTPGPDDPVMKLVSADGKVTEARLMTLRSVRLGQFEAKDVPCAVQPPSVKGSMNLLGGTFLKNFLYRMDLAAGELHMSQLGGKPAKGAATRPADDGAVAERKGPATTAPVNQVEISVGAERNAQNPVSTGLRVAQGQKFVIEPNAQDTWTGGGTHKGRWCGFRGYPDKPDWMVMKWKIGDSTAAVVSGQAVTAPENGELMLYCNDGKPAQNEGSIRAVVKIFKNAPPADEPAVDAGAEVLVEKGWTILFRSSDPSHWDHRVREGASYAVKVEKAPGDTRYLRMRNSEGDFVIIAMSFPELQQKVIRDKFGWEGRCYQTHGAFHLGIIDKSMERAKTGSIDVTQRPGAGWTGWGFGNRVNKDDVQGYVWNGKIVEKGVIEIAVTGSPLTQEEKKKLLGE